MSTYFCGHPVRDGFGECEWGCEDYTQPDIVKGHKDYVPDPNRQKLFSAEDATSVINPRFDEVDQTINNFKEWYGQEKDELKSWLVEYRETIRSMVEIEIESWKEQQRRARMAWIKGIIKKYSPAFMSGGFVTFIFDLLLTSV